MGSGLPRVTANPATNRSTASWLPALRPAKLDVPSESGATAWTTTDGRTLYGRRDGDRYALWCEGVATFAFDAAGNVLYDAVDDDEARKLWTRSALPLAVEARGLAVLHASAVSRGESCVVVCGRSTAGKSTIAAAAGLTVESDDAIAFSVEDGAVVALTLPFDLRPRQQAVTVTGDGGRRLMLEHVVILEPDPVAQVELEPMSAADAFGALMPHAYCFSLDDSKNRLVSAYTDLVARVPVYRLGYAQEPQNVPAMVELLRTLIA